MNALSLPNNLELSSIHDLKVQFAKLLIKYPDDPFKCAKLLFEPNLTLCLKVARQWPRDSEVVKFKNKILVGGKYDMLLPSKSEIASEVHSIAKNDAHTEHRLRGYELFCKMMGFVEKDGVTVNNVNNVMVVKDHGNDDEWEMKLLDQQKKLKET